VDVTFQSRHPGAIHRLDDAVLSGGAEGGQDAANGELAEVH
jgi:hypothetical protein